VSLSLEDVAQGTRIEDADIPLVIAAPSEAVQPEGTVPGLTDVAQGAGSGEVSLLVVAVAGLLLGLLVALLTIIVLNRRRTNISA
jgi:hypothetical protein